MSAVPLADFLDAHFAGASPSQIAFKTAAAVAAAEATRLLILHNGPALTNAKDALFSALRKTVVKWFMGLDDQIKENVAKIKFIKHAETEDGFHRVPENGLSDEQVVAISKKYSDLLDKKMEDTHLSGAVYHGAGGPTDMYVQVFKHHIWSNALFADFFGATRKIEAEVIEMGVRLFNGDPASEKGECAAFTSGGSESICMAMLAYRNWAKDKKGITTPVVVLGDTAHPAFDKAAMYYGIRLVKVPADPDTHVLSVDEIEKHLTDDTIAIVGSAPTYPHGVLDPIAELAALAKRRGIGMHVDACVGGFFTQFLDKSVMPVVDFRVDGVTTISADIHKWGGTPKGASLVLYKSKELRSYQIFAYSLYPGGLYTTMGPNGSKGGYTAALAWAALLKFGMKGYGDFSERTRVAAQKFRAGVEATEGVSVMGDPQLSIVAVNSEYFDIYQLGQAMLKHGWVFINLQYPPGIHLGLTLDHAAPGAMERLISDMKNEVAVLMEKVPIDAKTGEKMKVGKKVAHQATLYGSSQTIPDRGAVDLMLRAYVAKTVLANPVDAPEEEEKK